MLNKVFGNKKVELMDMVVYWPDDVATNDLVDDLQRIGTYMVRSTAQKNGCKIVTVKNWYINDTMYKMAELVVDKNLEKWIREDLTNKKFKAVSFTSTSMG